MMTNISKKKAMRIINLIEKHIHEVKYYLGNSYSSSIKVEKMDSLLERVNLIVKFNGFGEIPNSLTEKIVHEFFVDKECSIEGEFFSVQDEVVKDFSLEKLDTLLQEEGFKMI